MLLEAICHLLTMHTRKRYVTFCRSIITGIQLTIDVFHCEDSMHRRSFRMVPSVVRGFEGHV